MDFLVLIPSSMDANRNEPELRPPRNKTLENFVGNPDWRTHRNKEKASGKSFEHFVVEEFGRSMQTLDYIDPGLKEAIMIRSDDKNLPLYRLALYSKHKLGSKFWKETNIQTRKQASNSSEVSMAQDSAIEWTDATWNPVTGCTKISPGCKNCYAHRMARRLHAMGQVRYRNNFAVTLQPDVL